MRRLALSLIFLAAGLLPAAAKAADIQVTTGSYGTLCSSGGFISPSSISATAGDTITFTLQNNDPYGSMEIHNFPEGTFQLTQASPSHTTQPLTAGTINFYASWIGGSCMKGTGTVTVAAAPAPSPTPSPSPSPSPSPTPSPTTTSSPTPAKTTTTATSAPTPTTTTSTPASTPSSAPTPASTTQQPKITTAPSQQPATKPMRVMLTAAVATSGGVVLIGALALGYWLLFRRTPKVPMITPDMQVPPTAAPPPPPANPPSNPNPPGSPPAI